ncbi:MAG: class I SAM-dependent methyltransferase [Candidatus Binatia bacterium]
MRENRIENPFSSGVLHPWRYVTGALGGSPGMGKLKRLGSRLLYEYLARRYRQSEWTTMNYGYAALPHDANPIDLETDEPERFALQLYWRVATAGSRGCRFADLEVLEVGSGRGGGAAFIARSLMPRRVVALDFSSSATALARERYHGRESLEYVQGDAEHLSFDAASFDIVLNIESAHCYASIPRFLAEVYRVLRPDGELLFADFVSTQNGACERLQAMLAASRFRSIRVDDITAQVVCALELDEVRKRALLDRWVTGPFKSFARGAYAMEGTAMRRALGAGQTVYLAAVLRKDAIGGA